MDTPNEPLRKLLRRLQAERLGLVKRRNDLFADVVAMQSSAVEQLAFDQFVDDYRVYVARAETAVAGAGAERDHLAVLYLSADAMLLRAFELIQASTAAATRGIYAAKLNEANAQEQIARNEMADLVFQIGFDPETQTD